MNPPEPVQADLYPALEDLDVGVGRAAFFRRASDRDFDIRSPSNSVQPPRRSWRRSRPCIPCALGGTAGCRPDAGHSGRHHAVRRDERTGEYVFGRFEILERLGSGGAGTVFRARDSRLARLIALKVALGRGSLLERSQATLRARGPNAGRAGHPNIIPIYEFGESGGLPYIVEELCDGPNLAIWLRDNAATGKPVSIRSAADAPSAPGRGGGPTPYCAGIVHRDRSRQCVAVAAGPTGCGLRARCKSTKIGAARLRLRIAKLVRDGGTRSRPARPCGDRSLRWPPNRPKARGRSREVGPPADVESSGVILSRSCSTGRRPIEGRSDVDTCAVIDRRARSLRGTCGRTCRPTSKRSV